LEGKEARGMMVVGGGAGNKETGEKHQARPNRRCRILINFRFWVCVLEMTTFEKLHLETREGGRKGGIRCREIEQPYSNNNCVCGCVNRNCGDGGRGNSGKRRREHEIFFFRDLDKRRKQQEECSRRKTKTPRPSGETRRKMGGDSANEKDLELTSITCGRRSFAG